MNQAYAAYRQSAIQTASRERLLIMLYDGLILALERSKAAIAANQWMEANQQLVKAQDIVREGLLAPLDMRYEIAKSLAQLYEYWHRRLVEANVKKDAAIVEEILGYARDLREAWVQAAVKVREQALTESGSGGTAPHGSGGTDGTPAGMGRG